MTTTYALAPPMFQKFFDNNGVPLAGGLLFTYASGTTTKVGTAKDSLGTPNTNPIVLDARGECDLWLPNTSAYTLTLAPATDTDPPTNPIKSRDGITSQFVSTSGSFLPNFSGFAAPPSANVIQWSVVALRAQLQMFFATGTSNANTFQITNLPNNLWPARAQLVPIPGMVDNGATINTAVLVIETSGVMNFYTDGSYSAWNAGAVSKGLFGLAQRYRVIEYALT